MQLKNQTILITGGGSGIGLALAEALKAKGLKVLTVDMTDEKGVQAFAAEAINQFPNLNVVIHNAGIMKNEKLKTSDNSETATETVLTNLLGPILLTNALLPHFLKHKSAMVMTVTSGLAYLPLAMTPTYCATKAAIHSYTQSLRYQLKDTAIEVKELVPPYVRTSLMGQRQASDANAMPLEDFISEVISILDTHPEAEEILVKNVLPQRTASDQGQENYKDLFLKRNEIFFKARKQEWDAL